MSCGSSGNSLDPDPSLSFSVILVFRWRVGPRKVVVPLSPGNGQGGPFGVYTVGRDCPCRRIPSGLRDGFNPSTSGSFGVPLPDPSPGERSLWWPSHTPRCLVPVLVPPAPPGTTHYPSRVRLRPGVLWVGCLTCQ